MHMPCKCTIDVPYECTVEVPCEFKPFPNRSQPQVHPITNPKPSAQASERVSASCASELLRRTQRHDVPLWRAYAQTTGAR
jgi:hypothetical protein